MKISAHLKIVGRCLWIFMLVSGGFVPAVRAQNEGVPQIKLSTNLARARAVEDLTRSALTRDYGLAWRSLAQAFESGSPAVLDGYFVGSARKELGGAVASQRKEGLRSRYPLQEHSVEAVFYAPEGDVVELHDTARCELQVMDGGKLIHDEQVVLHYVVLMTPAADRWVVRQLQAVSRF